MSLWQFNFSNKIVIVWLFFQVFKYCSWFIRLWILSNCVVEARHKFSKTDSFQQIEITVFSFIFILVNLPVFMMWSVAPWYGSCSADTRSWKGHDHFHKHLNQFHLCNLFLFIPFSFIFFKQYYMDIILSHNMHHFSLRPFCVIAGSAVLATVPVFCQSRFMHCSSMQCSYY